MYSTLRYKLAIIAFGLLCSLGVNAETDFYQWVDDQGNQRFSLNRPSVEAVQQHTLESYEGVINANAFEPTDREAFYKRIQRQIDKDTSRIFSWEIVKESQYELVIDVTYFYRGGFPSTTISATPRIDGGNFGSTITSNWLKKGTHTARLKMEVGPKAPLQFCSNQIALKMGGTNTKVFYKTTVNFDKCWVNKYKLSAKESEANKKKPLDKDSRVVSWKISREEDEYLYLDVQYVYNGDQGETAWIYALAKYKGQSNYNSVQPAEIKIGEHKTKIYIGVADHAPKLYCTDTLEFIMYTKESRRFHEYTVPYERCWKNLEAKPRLSDDVQYKPSKIEKSLIKN